MEHENLTYELNIATQSDVLHKWIECFVYVIIPWKRWHENELRNNVKQKQAGLNSMKVRATFYW